MTSIAELNKVQEGTQIRLSDFHTLEEVGDSETLPVTDVSQWSVESLSIFGFTLQAADDVSLMLMVRVIGGEVSDCRLFRESDSCLKSACEFGMIISDELHEADFFDFFVVHAGEEDDGELEYEVASPFPFWGVRKNDGHQVALCEYLAVATEEEPIEDNYWAKYGFVEWYADMENEDLDDGLRTLWFGWDINEDDFDIV